ncbi:MAG: 2Fe-2S iron-sulfur cluster-binding protein [Sporichthyaceae bacterium]
MYEITVQPFGDTFVCNEGETILEAALREHRFLRYGCKHGGCGTCKVQLVDGDVDLHTSAYSLQPSERDAGTILVCQSYPLDDCELDAAAMNLDHEEYLAGDGTLAVEATLTGVELLTADICRVVLDLPVPMPFVAGQFVNVVVPGTDLVRTYSMANGSADPHRVELICKLLPGGAFSDFLRGGPEPGTAVGLSGPFGMLRIRLSHREIVMVAGGSGLAPLLSMLADLARAASQRTVTLVFGARTPADLYAIDEIAELQASLPGLTFVPVVQQPDAGWIGPTGVVTDVLGAREDWDATDAYLCGPPGMIDAATELLLARGVRPQNVYFDAFVPTGSEPAAV